jgi:hypothetical protein
MNCATIQKKLKPFLEDMLTEEEYQLFALHLDQCAECRLHVGRVGSLSNQIHELGQMEAPSDMAATILFRLKQSSQGSGASQFAVPGKKMISGFIFCLLAAAVVIGYFYFLKPKNIQSSGMVTSVISRNNLPLKSGEAEALLNQLHSIANSVRAEEKNLSELKDIQDKASDQQAVSKEPFINVESEKQAGEKQVNQTVLFLHWHLLCGKEIIKTEFRKILGESGVSYQEPAPDFFILSALGKKIRDIFDQIQTSYPEHVKLNAFGVEETLPKQEYHLMLHLQQYDRSDQKTFHWHLKFSQPNRFKMSESFRRFGAVVSYESKELLVLSISTTKLAGLAAEIRGIEGISADFGNGHVN